MFRFNQTIIREPTVCASLKLQYWRQLKYFVTGWINMRPHDRTVQ